MLTDEPTARLPAPPCRHAAAACRAALLLASHHATLREVMDELTASRLLSIELDAEELAFTNATGTNRASSRRGSGGGGRGGAGARCCMQGRNF